MNTKDRIVLEDLSISLGANLILSEIDWTIKAGQHWVITGNAGTGKTVLAESLAQKHRILKGNRSYPFLGENPSFDKRQAAVQMISFMDTSRLFRSVNAVHYYQQRFNAFDSDGHLTMRQYLEHGGIDIKQHQELLELIGIEDLLDLERIKLSSGQTRKMMLAKVLLKQAKILVLDNPYIGLDTDSRKTLNELLDHMVAHMGITLVLSGQMQGLPSCISHRLHINDDGTLKKGSLSDFPSSVAAPKLNEVALNAIKDHFQQKAYTEEFEDIIRFEEVNILYKDRHILKNINWTVKQGEKWAVIGDNGSGKSTILSLIYADNPQAYANAIYLFGVKRGTPGQSIWEVKERMGFTSPELHAYFDQDLNAREVVLSGLTDTFFLRRSPTDQELAFTRLLFDYFELSEKAEVPFTHLSTGVQRLLFFMRAWVKAPQVFLLDEPFQGLDEDMVFRCKKLIDAVLTEKHTLIFISHFKHEVPDCVSQELVI